MATAGWSLPREHSAAFPAEGSHLARYATVLAGAEINSSFYRSHARETYARWAAATPPGFRFAVKLPGTITHELQLRAARRPLEEFLAQVSGLGRKLGPLLIQLPPSLQFERRVADRFLQLLRARHAGLIVCEPRHPSWFTASADALLALRDVARVAADPAVVPTAATPGGSSRCVYYRLHGSPRKYWSVYPREQLRVWHDAMQAAPSRSKVWCVFDNTASGAAIRNALDMQAMSAARRASRRAV